MIRQKIYLPKYDWAVYCYYAVSTYYVDEIMERLYEIGVDANNAFEAYKNMSAGELDTGLCYSNYSLHKSVMVVSNASSPAEFFNSLSHEIRHLTSHIAKTFNLSSTGEPVAYLSGEISREIYPKVCHLLCNCHSKEHKRKRYDL